MEPTIFRFLRRYAWKQQAFILALTALTLPLGYATLELPKLIINRALGTGAAPEFFDMRWDRLELLWTLCGLFLLTVLVSGALKYYVNVYAGVVSERMLRRLRFQLFDHVLRFPLPHLKRVSQGELVQMINAEVEPLGGFVGQAVTTPGLQGGTLAISLLFMFVQDWILGMAAVALYPLQIWFIPKMQARLNLLGKKRVRQVRRNAEKISEIAGGVRDIRGNGATVYERARFAGDLAQVFEIRFDIYKQKFLIKFLNNFLAQLGPFFFYAVGGWLVIQGELTVGALVAVIGAQKDIAAPWKELLSFYQTVFDVQIKYDQVVSQFVPQGLRDEALIDDTKPENDPDFSKEVSVTHLGLQDEDGGIILDSVSFTLDLPAHVAIVGGSGAGKEELALCMAGLLTATRGRVLYDGADVAELAECVTGSKIAFVGNPTHIFAGSIRDNLLYGLQCRPVRHHPDSKTREAWLHEAVQAGNPPFYPDDEWIDFASVGLEDEAARLPRMIEVLRTVQLDRDAYLLGLRASLVQPDDDDLEARLLEARHGMVRRLESDERLSRLVEPFDPNKYNTNASLAENLIFGTIVGERLDVERLVENDYLRRILDQQDLTEDLIRVGYRLAATMVELFADLPPDHEYFRQFSFIDAEDLPGYRTLVGTADVNRLDALSTADRTRLLSLPFKLIPARHRLGLVEDDLRRRVLLARDAFRKDLPRELEGEIEFFNPALYNHALSVQDNILFGKVAYGQAQAAEKIAALIADILEEAGLRDRIIELGLRYECGLSGVRLSAAQRQKLGLARALMKNPDILILVDATGPLDRFETADILGRVLADFDGRTVIWALQEPQLAREFSRAIVLDSGKLVETGKIAELDREGTAFHALASR